MPGAAADLIESRSVILVVPAPFNIVSGLSVLSAFNMLYEVHVYRVGLSRSLMLSDGATPVLEGQVLQLVSTVGVPRAFQAALWNRNYFLRFRFRCRLLKSYGSCSGSDF